MKIGYAGAAIVCTFMLSNIASAAGRTIYVTNDGTDSAGCGAQANACRSISQGLENAVDGDTILVGAGRYGNKLDLIGKRESIVLGTDLVAGLNQVSEQRHAVQSAAH